MTIATRAAAAVGGILLDPQCVAAAALSAVPGERLFEPAFWAERGQLNAAPAGRGSAWFIALGPAQQWALRHYRRGGLLAPLTGDRYLWQGAERVRAFAEWRLLAQLRARSLPVPAPVGARYRREGLLYRCDLITVRIAGARPLSAMLVGAALTRAGWREIGATIARLHAAGVDHADLNAHNVLIGADGAVSIIDFDRGTVRPPGAWAARNLARLQRSLRKIGPSLPSQRFSAMEWQWLLDGYAEGGGRGP